MSPPPPLTKAQETKLAKLAKLQQTIADVERKRQALYDLRAEGMTALKAEGVPMTVIGKHTGLAPMTVQQAINRLAERAVEAAG